MSTRAHFIYEDGVEGFEETIESRYVDGKFIGYDIYLIIENVILTSFKFKDGNREVIIQTKTTHLPKYFEIPMDAILELDWDVDGLMLRLIGGHHVTNDLINLKFTTAS